MSSPDHNPDGHLDDGSLCPEGDEDDVSLKGGDNESSFGDTEKSTTSKEEEELSRKETNAVFRLRVLVILALLGATLAVSAVVYYITSNGEKDEFQSQFEGSAQKIISSFENVVAEKIAAVASLAVAATIYTAENDITWPYVVLDSFMERAATAKTLSDAIFLGMYPMVTEETREGWEEFSVNNFFPSADSALDYQTKAGIDPFGDVVNPIIQTRDQLASMYATRLLPKENSTEDLTAKNTLTETAFPEIDFSVGVGNHLYYLDPVGIPTYEPGPDLFFPIWQSAPFLSSTFINLNLNSAHSDSHRGQLDRSFDKQKIVLGGFSSAPAGGIFSEHFLTGIIATWLSFAAGKIVDYDGDPTSNVYVPIFDSLGADREPVGVVNAVIYWRSYFANILPVNVKGIHVVLVNECGETFTYQIDGPEVKPLGVGDLHDPKFDNMGKAAHVRDFTKVADGSQLGLELDKDECSFSLFVYPSSDLYNEYNTNSPIIITFCVAMTFVFTAVMFIIYDRLVERRQKLILRKATQSNALVSSLFPRSVADRLLNNADDKESKSSTFMSANRRVKSFLSDGSNQVGLEPIADLFPHATVMFADIAGFTAWSSTRDPAQVFILLQSIYQAFDKIATRRKVFKVETIGDSYVAVTGIPDRQATHVVIMARFAWECLLKFHTVVKDMVVALGPDTGELEIRIGIHSGPVTAGVLLGERARFQLFGDTVNTAARMESTGIPNRIQVSQSTAALLKAAGKNHWVNPRSDSVLAKGKGVLNTFWLMPIPKKGSPSEGSSAADSVTRALPLASTPIAKQRRLVNWMVELFLDHIRKISESRNHKLPERPVVYKVPDNKITLDEVAEVICLPKFDAKAAAAQGPEQSREISPKAVQQLHDYVSTIASMYCDNPFHNFEHACHVTMAVDKFMKRIVAPDLEVDGDVASHLHEYTHGINSDPLTLFAIVFSALIHDVDHRGVSNAQLMKEDEKMAALYRNKSVAEQNSLDLAWSLLMESKFNEIRCYLFATPTEIYRFRQVIVNMVLATDIFDKELNDLRKARWQKAFSGARSADSKNYTDLRATIVIEHIIQASDVSHTMQHWHVYRKWNARLFKEMWLAFKAGRMGADPSGFWYQGELGFFDNYIIPLAKKLKDCNVFGVSSDECLNYAELNRAEWEERGQHIVEEMMRELQSSDQQEHSIVHFDELDDELDNELEEALMEASSRSALLNEVEV